MNVIMCLNSKTMCHWLAEIEVSPQPAAVTNWIWSLPKECTLHIHVSGVEMIGMFEIKNQCIWHSVLHDLDLTDRLNQGAVVHVHRVIKCDLSFASDVRAWHDLHQTVKCMLMHIWKLVGFDTPFVRHDMSVLILIHICRQIYRTYIYESGHGINKVNTSKILLHLRRSVYFHISVLTAWYQIWTR